MSRFTAQEYYNAGVTLQEMGSFREAIKAYESALQIDARMHQAWCNLGIAHSEATGDWARAIECYRRALSIDSTDHVSWSALGDAFINIGSVVEALESYGKAVEICPSFGEAYYGLGVALERGGRQDEAMRNYLRAVDLGGCVDRAWNNLGVVLAGREEFAKAIDAFSAALTVNPEFVDALMNKGLALAKLHRPVEAIECYSRAVCLDPSAELWCKIGVLLTLVRQGERALAAFDNSLAIDRTNAMVWEFKVKSFLRFGKLSEALECTSEAERCIGVNVQLLLLKATILGNTGRREEAAGVLDCVLGIEPLNAEAVLMKAVAVRSLGREEEARELEMRAAELGADPGSVGLGVALGL